MLALEEHSQTSEQLSMFSTLDTSASVLTGQL